MWASLVGSSEPIVRRPLPPVPTTNWRMPAGGARPRGARGAEGPEAGGWPGGGAGRGGGGRAAANPRPLGAPPPPPADLVTVAVQRVHAPRPKVVGVVALGGVAGGRPEVGEVGGGTRGLVLVVAGDRRAATPERSPARAAAGR